MAMQPGDDAHAVFTALWVDHSSAVRAFAWRRCPSSMVDDVVAETFTVAWRHIDEVPEQARIWLLGCARRVIHTQLRSRDRYLALEQRLADSSAGIVEGVDELALDRCVMQQAWSQLGEDDRETLALALWDGLDSAQAAAVLGCTSLAFRARLSRARRRMRALLTAGDATEVAVPQGLRPRNHNEGDLR